MPCPSHTKLYIYKFKFTSVENYLKLWQKDPKVQHRCCQSSSQVIIPSQFSLWSILTLFSHPLLTFLSCRFTICFCVTTLCLFFVTSHICRPS
jgi:hypothetical protein